jgi:hypothetical protein
MMHPENGIKRRHAEICHMSTITNKGVNSVMDGFKVVVVSASVFQNVIGEDGVVFLGRNKLVCA